VLYNFEIELRPESQNWTDQEVYFVWDKPELWLNLKDKFPEKEVS
jgi:hypothetical protein